LIHNTVSWLCLTAQGPIIEQAQKHKHNTNTEKENTKQTV